MTLTVNGRQTEKARQKNKLGYVTFKVTNRTAIKLFSIACNT